MYLNYLRRFILFSAMSNVQSYKHKSLFICNAHHTLKLAVEGTEVCWRNAKVRMIVWEWLNSPGFTDDLVPETASYSYFCVGALKKQSVCFHIECNSLALFSEDINVNVQMLCMHKCHRGCLFW